MVLQVERKITLEPSHVLNTKENEIDTLAPTAYWVVMEKL
jgi:hypothetical protein